MSIADTLSIQLYSLRDYGDLDRQLDTLAELGFRRVETVGYHLADAEAVRAALDARGITAPTGHVGLAELREQPDRTFERAKIVGIETLFMPAVPAEEREAPAERWRATGEELGRLAQKAKASGLRLGYHNHHWELRAFADGTTPLETLLAAAGPDLAWQADLAWLVRGGADPIQWMERYRDRLSSLHVKDIAPEGRNADEDGWADVGAGVLDWPRLWREGVARGAVHMVLEHDKPSDAARFARASRDYILANIS